MIRRAAYEDVPEIVGMIQDFANASDAAKWSGFDSDSVTELVLTMLKNQCVFVLDVAGQAEGVLMCLAFPSWLNKDHKIAQELVWWINPDHRSMQNARGMLDAMEDWAMTQGCSSLEMGALESNKPEALTRYYARFGYKPKERLFYKEIG